MEMVVVQSFRSEGVPTWIASCMASVQQWAEAGGGSYTLIGDEAMLGVLPDDFKQKVGWRWPMLTDLGRLLWCRKLLDEGVERVLWLDADVIVCRSEHFQLPAQLVHGYAFGREQWVERDGRVRRGVHNALCVFERGNPMLDFYIHSCLRIMEIHAGTQLAPQLLGPKWLKMQQSMLQMLLLDGVAMWSPWVVEDLIAGGGMRLEKQLAASAGEFPPAVNLCASMLDDASGLKAVKAMMARAQ